MTAVSKSIHQFGSRASLASRVGEMLGKRERVRVHSICTLTVRGRASSSRSEVAGLPLFASGHGFGLGLAVVTEPEAAIPTLCAGGAGAVGWPGAFGGWWQADPNDASVLIFLAHNIVEPEQFARGVGLGVYEAIARFQAACAAKQH